MPFDTDRWWNGSDRWTLYVGERERRNRNRQRGDHRTIACLFRIDVCPLDTARNAEAADVLRECGISVTPVFISIDPKRDTPEVVGDFAANLHEDMIGLTGSEEQVKAASKAYRTYYKRRPGEDDYYLVDHSAFSYLVMPDDGFVEFFRRELSPEDVADRTACFVNAS